MNEDNQNKIKINREVYKKLNNLKKEKQDFNEVIMELIKTKEKIRETSNKNKVNKNKRRNRKGTFKKGIKNSKKEILYKSEKEFLKRKKDTISGKIREKNIFENEDTNADILGGFGKYVDSDLERKVRKANKKAEF